MTPSSTMPAGILTTGAQTRLSKAPKSPPRVGVKILERTSVDFFGRHGRDQRNLHRGHRHVRDPVPRSGARAHGLRDALDNPAAAIVSGHILDTEAAKMGCLGWQQSISDQHRAYSEGRRIERGLWAIGVG